MGTCLCTDGSRCVVIKCETIGLAVADSGVGWAEERLVIADIGGDVWVGVAPFRGDDIIIVVVFDRIEAVVGLREGVVVAVSVHFPSGHLLIYI